MLPILGGLEIGIPERPGAALPGAGFVDGAFPLLAVEKDAIAAGELLEAFPGTDPADKLLLEGLDI